MTKQALLDICKQNNLYRTPSLNDNLYLNFKGFSQIACLEEYVNLKALFLEGNVLESLEGLPTLKELKCLYVQQNCIWKISGLEAVTNLDTLNISNNQISRLEGLSCCTSLRTLIATHNRLASLESIAHLAECKSLQTLDLQNNQLEDPAILDVLKQIPDLRCLYLKGNPVVSNIKNYRKVIIISIPTLTYLDDRPVFDNERRTAEAWAEGGLEAERAMRTKLKEEEDERNRKNHEFMMQMRAQGWRERRKRLGLPEGDTDPALDELSDGSIDFEEDPPELVEARQRLAAYTARPGEEEPAGKRDVACTRQQLASQGRRIQEGHWQPGSAEQDSQVYLESVRAAQAELDVAAAPAAASAAAPRPRSHALPPDSPAGSDSEGRGGGEEQDAAAGADGDKGGEKASRSAAHISAEAVADLNELD
ncbi:hypothetical protein GPECTOR_56g436 [Gonium pectorale]|uniref:Dynein assembly factor 1, axonemal homolog n=1 Tax=Gonium pectorale TaxID=33097 RepID=A0A150G629_GONPE|nr:hypothetical protein GPECTOR_56g436 [Gonium pectorale]|eukprot:KXZ45339.1 hypothetical protein GPECTOR_56g436 [Gonium pectorale]